MDTAHLIPWFILLNPLAAAALILFAFRRNSAVSVTVSVLSALFGLVATLVSWTLPTVHSAISWIKIGPLDISLGVSLDEMSKVMLLVVTGIGFLVHLYSTVYMAHDDAKTRFFGHLSLFMFSMLGIVLADNFAMMFMFWELVGVSSYLLIGHWFTRDAAGKAANKAFIMNRIGDFGFMLGILMLWSTAGTVTFAGLQAPGAIAALTQNPAYLTVAILCVFCGAVGKSAQFPLHTWLPDAMEGPTPVSALIHAATMVAAGVFMLARVAFLIGLSPDAAAVIAWIGGITSLLAALMATQQDDIKRILAYSTLSQLGYMVMAIGVAHPDVHSHGGPAMYHLFTHAFFKALLFLGAGAVIHALHHEQDIWKMGGLLKKMPKTGRTFAIGTAALTGFPLLSGFWSKDSILAAASEYNTFLYLIGLFVAVLTAFYMTRLFVVAFLGQPRSDAAKHGHDGPAPMTLPLIVLAVLSVVSAYGTEEWFFHGEFHITVAIFATLAFAAGTGAAYVLYTGKSREPFSIGLFRNKFYFDEIYGVIVSGAQDVVAFVANALDSLLAGFVRVVGMLAWGAGFLLRLLQFGNVQGYAFVFGLGVVGLVYFIVFK